jgi:hypothetical protein
MNNFCIGVINETLTNQTQRTDTLRSGTRRFQRSVLERRTKGYRGT